jgi:hypothetical protein
MTMGPNLSVQPRDFLLLHTWKTKMAVRTGPFERNSFPHITLLPKLIFSSFLLASFSFQTFAWNH